MKNFLALLVLTALCTNFAQGQCTTFSASIVETSAITCDGNSDGVLSAVPSGGMPTYTYAWSNGITTQNNSNLSSGNYDVTITDANGCVESSNFMLSQPIQLSVVVEDTTDSFYSFGTNHQYTQGTAIVSGGTPPYSYVWSFDPTYNNDYFDSSFSYFTLQDTNFVTVIDGSGCIATDTFIVIQYPDFDIVSSIYESNGCFFCNGIATIELAGGTPPFTYVLEQGNNFYDSYTGGRTQTFTGLCGGSFSFSVTDSVGFWRQSNYLVSTISQAPNAHPPNPDVFTIVQPESCYVTNDAIVTVTPELPPSYYYNTTHFLWDNGATTQTASGLSAGVHEVTVSDTPPPFDPANNTFHYSYPFYECYWVVSVDVPGGYIPFDMNMAPTTCGNNDGAINITFPTTPASTLTYSWSTGATTNAIFGLAPGTYQVSVMDGGCQTIESIQVIEDPLCTQALLEGYVYSEKQTADCAVDPQTTPLSNKQINISSSVDSIGVFTDSNGYYSAYVPAGTYTVDVIDNTYLCSQCPTNPFTLPVTIGNTYMAGDFYLENCPFVDVATYFTSSAARPGFVRDVQVHYCNNGSDKISGTVSLVHDPNLFGFNGYNQEDTYDPNSRTVVWSYIDLLPGECRYEDATFEIPTTQALGTDLCDTTYMVQATDVKPNDNISPFCQEVTGSFDPNDKQNLVGENSFGGATYTEDSVYVYYIRFQNTGTDTAFRVKLLDTLDANLDPNTIRPINASHPYTLSLQEGNIFNIEFNNILLPDSTTNEPASHGFFMFSIELRDGLPLGTMVENSAAIYFDFNDPVITNTVVNTIALPPLSSYLLYKRSIAYVYPNPTTGILHIELEQTHAEVTAELFNLIGQSVYKKTVQQTDLLTAEPEVDSGVYMLQLTSDSGEFKSFKIIVE